MLDAAGTFLAESFGFVTTDARGANSTEAYAHVDVQTSLFATPSSAAFDDTSARSDGDPQRKAYQVYEATAGNVSVYAGDLSDDQRR